MGASVRLYGGGYAHFHVSGGIPNRGGYAGFEWDPAPAGNGTAVWPLVAAHMGAVKDQDDRRLGRLLSTPSVSSRVDGTSGAGPDLSDNANSILGEAQERFSGRGGKEGQMPGGGRGGGAGGGEREPIRIRRVYDPVGSEQ